MTSRGWVVEVQSKCLFQKPEFYRKNDRISENFFKISKYDFIVLNIYHHSVLPKGRPFTANSCTKAAVLPKGRSSIANSETKIAVFWPDQRSRNPNYPSPSIYVYIILNSCPTQDRVEGRDAMKHLYWKFVNNKDDGRPRLAHHHKGEWNETKWLIRVWINGGVKGKREELLEKHTQTPLRPPRNLHGVIETRTRNLSGGRRASNRMRHGAV